MRSENNPSQRASSLAGCQSKFLCTPRGAGPPDGPPRLSLFSHGPQPRTKPCPKRSDKSCNHKLCSRSRGSRNVAFAKGLSQACHDVLPTSLPAHALFFSAVLSACCISLVFLAGFVACLSQNSSQDYKSRGCFNYHGLLGAYKVLGEGRSRKKRGQKEAEERTRGASSHGWWAGGEKEEGETRRKQEVRMGRRQLCGCGILALRESVFSYLLTHFPHPALTKGNPEQDLSTKLSSRSQERPPQWVQNSSERNEGSGLSTRKP